MLVNAIIVSLVMFIIKVGERGLGKPMFERPLVTGPIVGLVLGDLQTGILMGASLELVFLGIVSIGGGTPSDAAIGSIFGTAFAILLGQGIDVALALAVPLGLLATAITRVYSVFTVSLLPRMAKHLENGNLKGTLRLHFMHIVLQPLSYALIGFLAIYFGVDSIQFILDSTPQTALDCLAAIGNVLPALGFAMLLNLMWSKALSIYMILGFVLAIYLKLPIIAIALLGTVVAVSVALRDLSIKNLTASNSNQEDQEEAFFQ